MAGYSVTVKNSNKNHIIISAHATQRLQERLPNIPSKNRQAFVSSARYNGLSERMLQNQYPKLHRYIASHFRANNSTQIRFYKNCVFIFSGGDHKSTTLRTVYNLTHNLTEEQIQNLMK